VFRLCNVSGDSTRPPARNNNILDTDVVEAGPPKVNGLEAGVLEAGSPKVNELEAGVLEAGGMVEAGSPKVNELEAGVLEAGGMVEAGSPKVNELEADGMLEARANAAAAVIQGMVASGKDCAMSTAHNTFKENHSNVCNTLFCFTPINIYSF
jgi:hypothetical protein